MSAGVEVLKTKTENNMETQDEKVSQMEQTNSTEMCGGSGS